MINLIKGDNFDFNRGDLSFCINYTDIYFITNNIDDTYQLSEKLENENIFKNKNRLMCVERKYLSDKFLRSCDIHLCENILDEQKIEGVSSLKELILFYYEIIEEVGKPVGLRKLNKKERKMKLKNHNTLIEEKKIIEQIRKNQKDKNIHDYPHEICEEYNNEVEDLFEKIEQIKSFYSNKLKISCEKYKLNYQIYSKIFNKR